jgi:hypothetical protein
MIEPGPRRTEQSDPVGPASAPASALKAAADPPDVLRTSSHRPTRGVPMSPCGQEIAVAFGELGGLGR